MPIKKYLLAGVIVWMPLAITVWLLLWLVGLFNGVFVTLTGVLLAVLPVSLHHWEGDEALEQIRRAEAFFVGGGETFLLLRTLIETGQLGLIRERVLAGVPYNGSSAGSCSTRSAPTPPRATNANGWRVCARSRIPTWSWLSWPRAAP